MLKGMPKVNAADPDAYMAQLVTILEGYDDEIVEYVTAPKTGVQTRVRYDLKPGDVKQACDDRVLAVFRTKNTGFVRRPYEPEPIKIFHGSRANLFIGSDHHRHGDVVSWSKTEEADSPEWKLGQLNGRDGIWISVHLWETYFVATRRERTWKSMDNAKLSQHYAARDLGGRAR